MTTPASTPTAGLSPRTVIQLPLTRTLAQQYVGNTLVPGLFEPTRMWGLCSRMVDVARVDSGAEARAVHGLTDDAADFPEGDGLFVLRFLASWPGLFRASFGGATTEGAARLDSSLVLPDPFLGTGYTKYAPAAVPEYWLELSEIPIGAEIWHLAEHGGAGYEQGVARYAGRHTGWHAFPTAAERGLTPAPGPAPTPADTLARGLGAVIQGDPYPADFGPNDGELTAYRAAPDGTMMSRHLAEAQCDDVFFRRLLTTWRGVPFELLAVTADAATLALADPNTEHAAALSLTPAGRHAWRAHVPRAELGELTEETRRVG
ncbi:hypothetical protein [Streptacidiphilus jiangxiensis]|uniref:Uncharacterized protein n=1 Tax=Streptacidiphilus jiangxiensis TaxID=235985 RepID=A0A1H7VX31_STRJI|nr:hypothetical protein [Streptacidiphilus jiangxiensis]SEM13358.1 hypothetical protein SAMN05414137_11935 [Streptacidiphilus jiangxiensis]